MKVSDKGLMAIIHHEGIVQSRYKDAVGVWTIGVGHTRNAGRIDPYKFVGNMPMREVFDLLRADIAKFEARVNTAVKVPIKQHEFDALVSFDFNTGGIHRASLTRHLNNGNRAAAAKAFMNWTKGGGKVLQALVTRRKEERAMFSRGEYPPFTANVYPATPDGRVQWKLGKRVNLVRELQISKPATRPEAELPPRQKPVERDNGASPSSYVPAVILSLAGLAAALWDKISAIFGG